MKKPSIYYIYVKKKLQQKKFNQKYKFIWKKNKIRVKLEYYVVGCVCFLFCSSNKIRWRIKKQVKAKRERESESEMLKIYYHIIQRVVSSFLKKNINSFYNHITFY
jgi:hypothetical protein